MLLSSLFHLVNKHYNRTPTINPVSRMPAEIILAILEAAYYSKNMEPALQLLANCAVVCKAWSAPSQDLLFRHVFLRSGTAFSSFRSAVDRCTNRGRALGDSVVRLHVTLDHNHPDQLSHHAFARAVCLCPNLYDLDVALYSCGATVGAAGSITATPSFGAGTLDLLRIGPRIQSLKLASDDSNDLLMLQLLRDVWTSLTAVSLKGTPPRMPASDDEALVPFTCSLRDVRFSFQNSPKMDFVRWLLSNSIHSLRSLELEREPTPEFLGNILRQYGLSLDSLSVSSCISREQVAAVQRCERLREFRLENTTVSPLLMKQLPDSVEHLAFALSRETPLYLMVNFVKARANLKAVTVHFWDGGDAHPQLPNLRIACACRGVELLSTYSIQCFREKVRGDPIPFTAFPRTKSPANLRRMLRISRAAGGANSESACRRVDELNITSSTPFCEPLEFIAEREATSAEDFESADDHPLKPGSRSE